MECDPDASTSLLRNADPNTIAKDEVAFREAAVALCDHLEPVPRPVALRTVRKMSVFAPNAGRSLPSLPQARAYLRDVIAEYVSDTDAYKVGLAGGGKILLVERLYSQRCYVLDTSATVYDFWFWEN